MPGCRRPESFSAHPTGEQPHRQNRAGRNVASRARDVRRCRPQRQALTASALRSPRRPSHDSTINSAGNERRFTHSARRRPRPGHDPIRNARRSLRGPLRYQLHETSRPKMLAAFGSGLGLVPHRARRDRPRERRCAVASRRWLPRLATSSFNGGSAEAAIADRRLGPTSRQAIAGYAFFVFFWCLM